MPTLDDAIAFVACAGTLGTAAFGLAEALKGFPFPGVVGVGSIVRMLGEPGRLALHSVYGAQDFTALLRGSYRKGPEAAAKVVKNGLAAALDSPHLPALAAHFGQDGVALQAAIVTLRAPAGTEEAKVSARAVLGRFELAVDARMDAALASAQCRYAATMQALAGGIAVAGGTLAAALYPGTGVHWYDGLLLGLVAVPLAPIAKDVTSFLRAAGDAVSVRAKR